MRRDIKEHLLATKKEANRQVERVLAARAAGTLNVEILRESLFIYVLAKFGLSEDEAPSHTMDELAEASLAKALRTNPHQVLETDRPATCDGARSVDMKQALLIMTMQREFEVKLDGIRAGLADTTDDLADLVFTAFMQTEAGASR